MLIARASTVVYAKASEWVHQVFTLDNYNHYIPLGVK